MDESRKKAIRQRLSRQGTPFANKWGMTPEQIRQAVAKIPPTPKNIVKKHRPEPKVRRRTTKKPLKARRLVRNDIDSNLLLEMPDIRVGSYTEISTPNWFRFTGKADISIIVPMFKSSDVIKELIDSWDLTNEGMKVEIIFVDDNCPMDSKSTVIAQWGNKNLKCPIGKIITSNTTNGYGTACNAGARFASSDFLIFLNADTMVTPGWIRPIIRLLRQDEIGIVGNLQLRSHTDLMDSAGSEWDWEAMCFLHIGRDIYKGHRLQSPFTTSNYPKDLDEIEERDMVTGACLAMRKSLFDEIGGFNPNYRIGYWEDSEICMCVKEKDLKIVYQPNSKIYHKVGHSNSGSHRFQSHNQQYFMNKWVHSGRIDKLVTMKRPKPKQEIRHILLKREASHGDVLMAAAVASALKKKYNCKITFSTNCPEITHGNPHIDNTIPIKESKERSFNLAYNLDMAYELRPKTNFLTAYAELVGVNPSDCELFLPVSDSPEILPEKYIVIHAGKTRWVGRDWARMKFELVANKIRQSGKSVVCVGSMSDHKVNCEVDLRGKTNISQLAGVIKNASLFLGIDSFPMHVAQTFNVPGVVFFGCINPKTRIIRDNMFGLVAEGLTCLGCHHRRPPAIATDVCETELQDCINLVTVDHMLKRANEAWSNSQGENLINPTL